MEKNVIKQEMTRKGKQNNRTLTVAFCITEGSIT